MSLCIENPSYICHHPKFSDSQKPHFLKNSGPCSHLSESAWRLHFEAEEGLTSDNLWLKMQAEERKDAEGEPMLAGFLCTTVLAHKFLESALAFQLASKLSNSTLSSTVLYNVIMGIVVEDTEIREAIRADLRDVKQRDLACISYIHFLLNFKGFQACQAHRVAHKLWSRGRIPLTLAIQNRVSEVFAVDIHPGTRIDKGILFDHATGLVVGETAIIGNNISILHNVTLGGTGKQGGNRHPKFGDGVLIGTGTNVLGYISIGEGTNIRAGSVVLTTVPPYTTTIGNPARLIGGKLDKTASLAMDHTSFISEWSDYVIKSPWPN